jgi:cbb3-type cytochrome oxidase subunit 3
MLFWILGGLIVLALAVYAFWPHKRGIVDSNVRDAERRIAGRGDYFGG